MEELRSLRDGFGEALLEIAEKDKNIVVVSADLAESTRVLEFAKKYPERFFEVGVAEQNLAGVAAGLALSGKTVFATSFASFSPYINFATIRQSICMNKANVKIVATHAGLMTGADGATHQALSDTALMRVLPNMVVLVPADFEQTKKAVFAAAEYKGPVYLRLTRPETPSFSKNSQEFKIGGSQILKKGDQVTIIGCGPIISQALKAIEELNFSCELINCYSIKPLDKETILASIQKTGAVVTIEDHQTFGGLGSAISELIGENYPVPIQIVAVKDKFGTSCSDFQKLWQKYKIDAGAIVKAIKKVSLQKDGRRKISTTKKNLPTQKSRS